MDVAQDVVRIFTDLGTAVSATSTACKPLLDKIQESDSSLDMSEGISLLLLRPQLLLSSLHQLIIMTALRIAGASADIDASDSAALTAAMSDRARVALSQETVSAELAGELAVNQEVFDKVRGLETKLEYQIKKLVGLAEASEKTSAVEEVEEDLLAFRPNPSALLRAKEPRTVRTEEGEESELYRPPRVAAVPYEPEKKKRSDRRAPALLSEFADTLGYAPIMESTSGLSTRPVQAGGHTNSISAKRAAELQRMDQFEEENMTRLVTNKREAKRRRDDEEALALGYGVGGPARSRGRRQNGLEAELEGVLGERRSKGVWDGVKTLGERGSALERGKGSSTAALPAPRPKKARFDKEMAKRRAK